MYFFILVLIICLFIFLYCTYALTHDDFIFLRRDVTMEKLFNVILLGSLISLFTARLFYGLFHVDKAFLNPFVFLLFPYFPGLSLLGAIIGAETYLLLLIARKKDPLPSARMSDFFSIAFLISLPIGLLAIKEWIQAVLYLILFIIFLKFFLPKLLNGKFKEGTIALMFLILFSLISLIANGFSKITILNYFKNPENLILIFFFLLSSGILIRHENLLSKLRQFKKGK